MSQKLSTGARWNLALLWLTRHWLKLALVFLGLYTALPIVAPVLMRAGLEGPARAVYSLYTPMCHRFAFRSLFLFGEQPAYPLESTGSDLRSFEYYAAQSRIPDEMRGGLLPQPPFNVRGLPEFSGMEIRTDMNPVPRDMNEAVQFARFQVASASFLGNDEMGYKMGLCARDIAIYAAMFAGALAYLHPTIRRRLRPCPLWLYVILGVGPIGLDGFSQMLGYPPFSFWPARETLPEYRVLTGALFGIMTFWLGFPNIQDAMNDAQKAIVAKFRRKGIEV